MSWIETLAGREGERFLRVAGIIDEAAADPEWREHVSVLGFRCGSGKSSAISLKIAETLHAVRAEESSDGLLIVSDTKEALKRYLSPDHMPRVKAYLDQCKDMISRMDGDTYRTEKDRFWHCPVLLITYKRYFSCEKSFIKNRFLRWGNGNQRTLIIMDEEPPILEHIAIGNLHISKVDAAIRDGLVTRNEEDRQWCISTWERISSMLHSVFEGQGNNLFGDMQEKLFLHRAEEPLLQKDELTRFVRLIDDSQETILEKDMDAPVFLEQMLRIVTEGAYGSVWKRKEGNMAMAFYGIRNNRNIMTDMGAKIVVLDGTADISTAYDHDYIHKVPCEKVNTQQYPELTVRLVNLNTSKTAFVKRQEVILTEVREYLKRCGEDLENVFIFTHKDRPERGFRREHLYAAVEHFRNLRGRNDLSGSVKVAQVGVYQKPPIMYTLECFEKNRERVGDEDSLDAAVREFPEKGIHSFLRMMNKEAKEPYELMIREAVADFEQNVFRTAIRNPDNTTPVMYYLFADTDYFSLLIQLIKERFDEYGADVEYPDSTDDMLRSIRRKDSAAHRLIDWLANKSVGDIFSKKEMLTETGLSENQFASVKKDHPMIAEMFKQMNDNIPAGRLTRGYYMMDAWIKDALR